MVSECIYFLLRGGCHWFIHHWQIACGHECMISESRVDICDCESFMRQKNTKHPCHWSKVCRITVKWSVKVTELLKLCEVVWEFCKEIDLQWKIKNDSSKKEKSAEVGQKWLKHRKQLGNWPYSPFAKNWFILIHNHHTLQKNFMLHLIFFVCDKIMLNIMVMTLTTMMEMPLAL